MAELLSFLKFIGGLTGILASYFIFRLAVGFIAVFIDARLKKMGRKGFIK